MKKLLFAICGVVIFAGCKEHGTSLDFGSNLISQTTYVASPVPRAEAHQVLVEEFTGQSCPNCPAAHVLLDTMSSQNPGRINVISMYTIGGPVNDPPNGAQYDFRDAAALNILNEIYGGSTPLPATGADRVSDNGSMLSLGAQSLSGPVTSRLIVADSVNLLVTSSYNVSKNIATITAAVTFTQAFSTPQNLSIVVVEDSINDLQEFPGDVQSYWFMDVFRGMVTSVPAGDVLQVSANSNTKVAGRVFQKVYSYVLPAKSPVIVPAHCRVIAFVNTANGADKHVLQSAQCKLVP